MSFQRVVRLSKGPPGFTKELRKKPSIRHTDCLLSAAFPVHLDVHHPLHVSTQRLLEEHSRVGGEPDADVDHKYSPQPRLSGLRVVPSHWSRSETNTALWLVGIMMLIFMP